jgi:hypothetical protein
MIRFAVAVVAGFLLFAGPVWAQSDPVVIKDPSPKNFQLMDTLDALCRVVSKSEDDEPGKLRETIASLRDRMNRLNKESVELMARRLTDADQNEVDRHNAAVQKANADLDRCAEKLPALAEAFSQLLSAGEARVQQKATHMTAVAYFLAVSGRFDQDPKGNGQTHCNQFAHAFAKLAFGYDGFEGKTANEIVADLRKREIGWDAVAGKNLQERLKNARDWANEGYLVVASLEEKPHGHIAIVVPGDLVKSGQWGLDVPEIAQAGRQRVVKERNKYGRETMSVFGREAMSYGFEAKDKDKIEIFIRKR